MDRKLRWLHISDIHYSFDNYSTSKMRSGLVKYIEKYVQENGTFNFIAITGDIAYRGSTYNKDTEDFINNIIKKSGVSKENLFIVPGNHDLDRSKKKSRLIDSIVNANNPLYEIDNLDEDTYNDLIHSQKKFWIFYNRLTNRTYNEIDLHFIEERDCFNIINLNTSLLCGGDNEEGKISIFLNKLFKTLNGKLSNDKLNIAIGHHNIDCLLADERKKVMNNLVDEGVDIYLCGHSHLPSYSIDNNNDREFYTVMSGAGVIDGYAKATFIVGEAYENNCSIEYYSWDDIDEVWSIETKGLGRNVKNGIARFELKKKECNDEEIYIEEDEFKDFIIEFHENIDGIKSKEDSFIKEDIEKKFSNMKCNSTVKKQFNSCSQYFSIIDEIMNDSTCLGFDKKIMIPSVIYEEYNNTLDKYATGGEILEAIVRNIYNRYKTKIKYPEIKLKLYIKTLVFWLINECDIYDDVKE
ncbi:metallophosphoesterase [Romboutsia hominis]|uniref:Metallophosphoesterase n=1 Tax=Romboutsia faecis TaxID=2764597 RepID=A0ABR7JNK9_9FIRM|nr:metallophosphoesterase [Romboutsia faecis]MBC5996514.1 metallophosphoesterase [Romboutsia faecis]